MSSFVYIVRHGERIDDVQKSWKATAERPLDPPLTERGVWQAKKTGQRILSELAPGTPSVHGHPPHTATKNSIPASRVKIFSSPFLRCLQTSVQIARCLAHGCDEEEEEEDKESKMVSAPSPNSKAGLSSNNPLVNQAKGAVEESKQSQQRSGEEHVKASILVEDGLAEFLSPLYFDKHPVPLAKDETLKILDTFAEEHRSVNKFPVFPESMGDATTRMTETVRELVHREHNKGPSILVMVTHGFGVEMISERFGSDVFVVETPYCCVTKFEYRFSRELADLPVSASNTPTSSSSKPTTTTTTTKRVREGEPDTPPPSSLAVRSNEGETEHLTVDKRTVDKSVENSSKGGETKGTFTPTGGTGTPGGTTTPSGGSSSTTQDGGEWCTHYYCDASHYRESGTAGKTLRQCATASKRVAVRSGCSFPWIRKWVHSS